MGPLWPSAMLSPRRLRAAPQEAPSNRMAKWLDVHIRAVQARLEKHDQNTLPYRTEASRYARTGRETPKTYVGTLTNVTQKPRSRFKGRTTPPTT